jgi:predicted Zn finger-like uncharacterized protein
MALAARCPHCRALFRVVADQLKLRGGLVRCGECRRVFDAIGSLSYVDDHALVKERAEAPVAGAAAAGPPVPVPAAARPLRPREPAAPTAVPASPRVVRPVQAVRRSGSPAGEIRDELAVPTLFGIAEEPPEPTPHKETAAPDSGQAEPASRPRKRGLMASIEAQLALAGYRKRGAAPADHEAAASEATESQDSALTAPSFLPTEDQERQEKLRRGLAIACVPLAILAAVQIGLAMREDALESWPSMRPLLAGACSLFGCTAGWPEHAELLTIIGSELASIPGTDVIELNAAIRSRAGFIMALPAIEVTLTDTQNRVLARKVFMPADYLASTGEPSSRIDEGLAPGSDLSVRLVFEARGLNASGFVLYPFYL